MTTATRITIGPRERACINCKQYSQCYREIPVAGETYKKLIPVSFGWCELHDARRTVKQYLCGQLADEIASGRVIVTL